MLMGMLMSFLVRLPGFLDNAMEGLGQSNILGVQAAALKVCLSGILPLLQRLRCASLPIVCLQRSRILCGSLQYDKQIRTGVSRPETAHCFAGLLPCACK